MPLAAPTVPANARPTADFNDPLLCVMAYRCNGTTINGYLMALAAWQRGLHVVFHAGLAGKSARFGYFHGGGQNGELLSVSDGTRTHYFHRTLGDMTSRAVSERVTDKHRTKQVLLAHGIDVPDGIVVSRADTAQVADFLARHRDRRFILKPLTGTQGEGVQRNLAPGDVLAGIARTDGTPQVLEEFVSGVQYRCNVVGSACVGAYEIRPANVLGDGHSSIAQLVEHKHNQCNHRPLHPEGVITLGEAERAFLARQGHTETHVPTAGTRIQLSDIPDSSHGADSLDALPDLPDSAAQAAIRACAALEIPNAGLDIIVSHDGLRTVVLEANQNAMLRGNVFPRVGRSPGNRVAEAIIDHYFPESQDNPRLTAASFDFPAVCRALQSGAIAAVALPVLGPGWAHERLAVPAAQVNADTAQRLRATMQHFGIHGYLLNTGTGELLLDAVAPGECYGRFLDYLGARVPAAAEA